MGLRAFVTAVHVFCVVAAVNSCGRPLPSRGNAGSQPPAIETRQQPTASPVAPTKTTVVAPPAATAAPTTSNDAEEESGPSEVDLKVEEAAVLADFDAVFAEVSERLRREQAKQRGFTQVTMGLGRFLEEVRDRALPISEVRKTLVELSQEDEGFRVVLVNGSLALFDNERVRIVLKGKSDQLYEDTPLTSLDARTYTVTGTKNDGMFMGHQAFVINAIPDLDVTQAALLEIAKRRSHEGFGVFAEFVDGQVVECADLPDASMATILRMATVEFLESRRGRKAAALLSGRCERVFLRPHKAICLGRSDGQVTMYPAPDDFDGFSKERCEKFGGTWSVAE